MITILEKKKYIEPCSIKIHIYSNIINGVYTYKKLYNEKQSLIKLLHYIENKEGIVKNNIVVKYNDYMNKKEFAISRQLNNIEGFIKYIGIYRYIEQNGGKKYILVSKFYNCGSIATFKWNKNNIIIIKSILQQTLLSIMYAYIDYGFIYDRLVLSNILLQKTKKDYIYYRDITIKHMVMVL